MVVGERIGERLKELGLSQSELARRVDLPQTTINTLVRGGSRTSRHLHRIARVLRTTPAYLSGETDDPDADAPDEPDLTRDEAGLLEIYRQLPKEDRAALKRVAERMLGPRTLHAPSLNYRAED
jgi:transcriptional regulator with XRE-family HTH domain